MPAYSQSPTDCGDAGHGGASSTLHAIRKFFHWPNARALVASFVFRCLLCLLSKSGERIPHPRGEHAHADKPDAILHFDYRSLGPSIENLKYILVLKDDLSSYTWLVPFAAANAENATTPLAHWCRTFAPPTTWVCDQDTHFMNSLHAARPAAHRIRHRPMVAYAPWSNGTVEALVRPTLADIRALVAELRLAPTHWPAMVETTSYALKGAPFQRLGARPDGIYRCPLEAMTAITPSRSLQHVLSPTRAYFAPASMSAARAAQLIPYTTSSAPSTTWTKRPLPLSTL